MALGEFEHLVLLSVLQLQADAFGPNIAHTLELRAHRRVTRGALYSTLDRLERKSLIRWEIEAATSERSGSRRRRFEVTPVGLAEVRRSRETLLELWQGLDDVWAGSPQ